MITYYYLAYFLITEKGAIVNSGVMPYKSKEPYPVNEIKRFLSDYLVGQKFDIGLEKSIVILNLQKIDEQEYEFLDKDIKFQDK